MSDNTPNVQTIRQALAELDTAPPHTSQYRRAYDEVERNALEWLRYLLDQLDDYKAQLNAAVSAGCQSAERSVQLSFALEAAQAQLDAKDKEIAGHLDQIHRRDVTVSVLQGNLDSYVAEGNRLREIIAEMQRVSKAKDTLIAERDATIARQRAENEVMRSTAESSKKFAAELNDLTTEQAKELGEMDAEYAKMMDLLKWYAGGSEDGGDKARDLIQSLKEPNG